VTQTKKLITDGPILPKSDIYLCDNVEDHIVRNGKTAGFETLFESDFAFRTCYHFKRYNVLMSWAGAAMGVAAFAGASHFYLDQTIEGVVGSIAGGAINFGVSKILGMKNNKALITLGFCAGAFFGVAHANKAIRDRELHKDKGMYSNIIPVSHFQQSGNEIVFAEPKNEPNLKSGVVSAFRCH
jgi:hypothetical protein